MMAYVKKLLLTTALLVSISAIAQDDAWQSKGEQMFTTLGCSGCHGAKGEGTTMAPKLAGSSTGYIIEQLKMFQAGTRDNATMMAMAQIARGHESIIACWLSSQPSVEF
jgi:cytochrome c553